MGVTSVVKLERTCYADEQTDTDVRRMPFTPLGDRTIVRPTSTTARQMSTTAFFCFPQWTQAPPCPGKALKASHIVHEPSDSKEHVFTSRWTSPSLQRAPGPHKIDAFVPMAWT